ncbi:hypothetical protein N3K66_006614 [Trichothecium roseum]|uniref:Uncharacterized protein n=1 Tax=Trichothecium roseum TaxID=47278 RepID=A0ACC0UWA1_9HYPO|nr:hypothetical protein N3K66_006614 [Trichothecium roseum]
MGFEWITDLVGVLGPVFIVASPVISYSDQAYSMQRNKTSAGFSLDIPLIMLVASLLRIFYWPGEHYDVSLLLQSLLMVGMQVILLKVALDHRPAPSTKGGEAGVPFAGAQDNIFTAPRPYSFWQWRSPKPYWQFLLYLFGGLIVGQVVLSSVPALYHYYSDMIGFIGLGIEATLPLPQILNNMQTRSCKGFRLSLLAAWIGGDAMKMFWFFTSTSDIPLVFKVFGMFQASCDCFLGVQYWMYGEGETVIKEHPMTEQPWSPGRTSMHAPARSLTPTRRPAPFSDKPIE